MEMRTIQERLTSRLGKMRLTRETQMEVWREVQRVLLPYAGHRLRNQGKDTELSDSDWGDIIDETGTTACELLEAGMMTYKTNPARFWFRLKTHDRDLNRYGPVAEWLYNAAYLAQDIYRESNTYLTLSHLYGELGAFGISASIVVPDYETVIHHYPQTAGEYMIGTDHRGNVDTLFREFSITAGQAEEQFGRDNLSRAAQSCLEKHSGRDSMIEIVHAIEPRRDRDPSKRDGINMPWASVYFEPGGDDDRVLSEGGFRRFPCVVPRWRVRAGNHYGEGPGHKALGSIKQLQAEQLAKDSAIALQADPPLQAPTDLKNNDANFLPGGVSFYDASTQNSGIRNAFEVPLRLDWMHDNINDVRDRINTSFFVQAFQMLAAAGSDTNFTATEILERREEKFTLLGPVTQRLERELDTPLIKITFDRMIEADMLPPPPPELNEMDLQIEFEGPLAQAMKAINAGSLDRYVASVGTLAQLKPDVIDKLDADKMADAYADMYGIEPDTVVTGRNLALIRQERQEAAAQQVQAEGAATAASTAKDLAAAPMDTRNALTELAAELTGQAPETL